MSVIEHLRELRRRLIVMVMIIAAGAVVGWVFYDQILSLPEASLLFGALPASPRRGEGRRRTTASSTSPAPLDGFTTKLKVSFIAGIILTAPFWLYQVWAFITPGLRKNERKYTLSFIIASTRAVRRRRRPGLRRALQGPERPDHAAPAAGTAAALTINSYLNFVVLMLVVFGAAFEVPLLVVMANLVGVLPAKLLKKSQRIGIFLIFLFAAVATPSTDPFTMCAMAVPMCVLFEGAVLFAVDPRPAQGERGSSRRRSTTTSPSAIDPIPRPISRDDFSDTT